MGELISTTVFYFAIYEKISFKNYEMKFFFKKTLDFFLESDIITMLLTGNNKKQHKTVQCGMV